MKIGDMIKLPVGVNESQYDCYEVYLADGKCDAPPMIIEAVINRHDDLVDLVKRMREMLESVQWKHGIHLQYDDFALDCCPACG